MRSTVPPESACRTVLMVGTDLAGMGGIRTVVEGYIEAGLFEEIDCTYVTTHRPGSHGTKLIAALSGWTWVTVRLATLDSPLVHVHLSSRASFWRKSVVCLLARLLRRPYLLHVHGSEFQQFYDECSPLARRIIRLVLAKAVLVLALSEAWRATLQQMSPRARIEVLMNAVPLPLPDELRRRADREPTLLFLGEIARHKGVFELVQAFGSVTDACPSLQLVFAGTGAAMEEVRQLASQAEFGGRIECTGWVEAQRKRAELARATIFVLPSYVEGMPMALLEAMSWGLPVIATAVGGVPEMITHEVNGLLVEPGDIAGLAAAISRLMSDAGLRARLGDAARETIATRFSLNTAFERLLEIYRRFGIRPRGAYPRPDVCLHAAADEK
jgi:glycosyltransferase involved in cell wall biosynthesis